MTADSMPPQQCSRMVYCHGYAKVNCISGVASSSEVQEKHCFVAGMLIALFLNKYFMNSIGNLYRNDPRKIQLLRGMNI